MGEIAVIYNQEVLGKDFRIYGSSDEPLFLAKDVAEWIGHSQTVRMIESVDDDEKVKVNNAHVDGRTGGNGVWFLTEDGVYEVLMQSRKPIAKQFKKKVKEILRTIRKHGAYMTPETIKKALLTPDFVIGLATELKKEQEKVRKLTPKAEFYDAVADCSTLFSMADVAKTLDMEIARNNLYSFLRKKHILQGNNMPYQRYVDRGYFNVVEWEDKDGVAVSKTIYVKQRGVNFIRKLLLKG